MLTQQEITNAKLYANGDWSLLSYELNAEKQKAWRGFHETPLGAVVASIPIPVYNEMRKQAGWDGSEYDQVKFNRMLNDPDNRAWRTGGGRLKTDNKKVV